MKKALVLTLAAVMAVSLVACSSSDSSTPSSVPASSAPASSVSQSEAVSMPQEETLTVTGTLSEVTEEGFTVTTADGTAVTFALAADTAVTVEGGLVDGAEVTVSYTGDAAAADAAARTIVSVDPVAEAETAVSSEAGSSSAAA